MLTASFLTQLQQQLSDNQTDIDSPRADRENQYQLNQIVERQKQILLQIDSLSSGGGAASGAQAPSSSGDQSAAATSAAPAATSGAPAMTGDANTDYNAAIAPGEGCLTPDDAMVAFQNFVKKYPDSTYQPNANYWLGQLNYNKGEKTTRFLLRFGGEELPEIAKSA